MAFFKRKRSLLQRDLKTLSMDELLLLRRALMLKLIGVNDELKAMYHSLVELGADVPGAEDSVTDLASAAAEYARQNNELLKWADAR